MQIVQNLSDLSKVTFDVGFRKFCAGTDICLQVISIHKINDGIDTSLILNEVIDLREIWMVEIFQNIHLCPQQKILGEGAAELLDHHVFPQTKMIAQIYRTGTAVADGLKDLIGTVDDLIL